MTSHREDELQWEVNKIQKYDLFVLVWKDAHRRVWATGYYTLIKKGLQTLGNRDALANSGRWWKLPSSGMKLYMAQADLTHVVAITSLST